MTKQASHLLDEPPILVYPSLAKAMGVNKAIIFQQLHFLLNATKTAQAKNNFVDGRWWVYNSYPQWRAQYFPWLSIGAIKRLFLELERDGFVLSKQSVKSKADRRKWYAIDYTTWEQFVTTIGTICDHTPSAQFETISSQNETMDGNKMSQSIGTKSANEIPETTTKTTQIKTRASKPDIETHKDAIIELMKVDGYDPTMVKPENLSRSEKGKYADIAAELAEINIHAHDIPALYKFVCAIATSERWSVKVKSTTLSKNSGKYLQSQMRKVKPPPVAAQPPSTPDEDMMGQAAVLAEVVKLNRGRAG